MKIDFTKFENAIIKKVARVADKYNYESYIVGGYVRDALLGIESNDIDFMVNGDATEFAEFVSKEINSPLTAVYKKFGTALIQTGEYKLEFSSARKESYEKNSRKPLISFSNLDDDLARRDFTINTLAVPLGNIHEIIDKFGGISDLDNKIIRTPLEPQKTFDDDPLRIMRALRFASTFDFSIHSVTLEAINKMAFRLKEDGVVSQERITNEFMQILGNKKPSIGLDLMFLSGVMDIVFPEIAVLAGVDQKSEYHHKDVFAHTLQVLDNVAKVTDDIWLRFSALVHDIAKPKTKKFIHGQG